MRKIQKCNLSCFPLNQVPSTLNEVCHHLLISQLLYKINSHITQHLQNEDETRISNLGFYLGTDPTNMLEEEMEE